MEFAPLQELDTKDITPGKTDDISKDEKEGKNSYMCSFEGCTQAFSRRFNLKRHILLRHSNIRKYTCTLCDKKFPLKQYLVDHLQWHSGDRKFACDFPGCTKRFFKFGRLNSHRKTHPGYEEWRKGNQISPRKPYELQVQEMRRANLQVKSHCADDICCEKRRNMQFCANDTFMAASVSPLQFCNSISVCGKEDSMNTMLSFFALPNFVQHGILPKPDALIKDTLAGSISAIENQSAHSQASNMNSWVQERPMLA
mmetsp:Transcript_9489/g.10423  ORF Transcript_9489/g.10423 Transcript_9489/m.10423 type:complete len:255 (+) Transcript_9489:203-967(+)|eukprot:CAMPEP_0115011184 /NCGR_PEP_ID=MMETSP0216-20121206/23820_1 /TAXON_ID=223996 /ORGANISM="Protocruzia adherens, Strain Boccale" /LENGTH=254 /DNA_ID=CAMNT_0002379661 /DNA_START=194 /DNA_END=958 /DNA_ORIENTATION=-